MTRSIIYFEQNNYKATLTKKVYHIGEENLSISHQILIHEKIWKPQIKYIRENVKKIWASADLSSNPFRGI